MKKAIFIMAALISLITMPVGVYSQTYQWVNSGGGLLPYDRGTTICQDQYGNTYVSGIITGAYNNMVGRVGYFNDETLTFLGDYDLFIAKYDQNGSQLWVKNYGGYSKMSRQILYNPITNAIYLTGEFNVSCTFDAYTLFETNGHLFLAKFDLDGNCEWAKNFGSYITGYGSNSKIACMNDKIYITGSIQADGFFDSYSVPEGGFLAKYNDNGQCLWAKNIFRGIINPIYRVPAMPLSIKENNNDLFILAEKLSDSVCIDTIEFCEKRYFSNILVRIDSSGNLIWAKQMGGPRVAFDCSLAVDASGNSYFGNLFNSEYSIFESDTVYGKNLRNFFLVRYDRNGIRKWVKQGYATCYSTDKLINCISIGLNDNIYLTGSITGDASFGKFDVKTDSAQEFYIARYNSEGECIGVFHDGPGTGYEIFADNTGACLFTGRYGLNIAGPQEIKFGSCQMTTHGYDDYFIAKIHASGMISSNDNKLFVYSNPAHDIFHIALPDEFADENQLLLYVFDICGKAVIKMTISDKRKVISVNIETQAKGIYNVLLTNGKNYYSGKAVFN
jgi:hypothetical protein